MLKKGAFIGYLFTVYHTPGKGEPYALRLGWQQVSRMGWAYNRNIFKKRAENLLMWLFIILSKVLSAALNNRVMVK